MHSCVLYIGLQDILLIHSTGVHHGISNMLLQGRAYVMIQIDCALNVYCAVQGFK